MPDRLKVNVTILTSTGCRLCGRAKEILVSAASEARVNLELRELNIDTDSKAAVEWAIENNMDHVPSFIIGSGSGRQIFIEDLFTEENVRHAFYVVRAASGDTKIGA